MSSSAKPTFRRLSDLSPLAIDWLWPGYLATGKLTLIDGDPDQGKSLVTLDLAARLTTGRPLPDGYVPLDPQSVVLLGGEDALRDTVIPRLRAAGADISRIHVVRAESADGGLACPVSLPEDCDVLRGVLRDTGARLLVADPLFAFLNRIGATAATCGAGKCPLPRRRCPPRRPIASSWKTIGKEKSHR